MIPDNASYKEKYDPAMKVSTEAEAQAYFEECVEHTMRLDPKITRERAEDIERRSIGEWSGFFGSATMATVRRLYGFGHPRYDETRDVAEQAMERLKELCMDWVRGDDRARRE